ncbi:uncharacterized protein in vnfD 5'region-like [Planococcus citri]|uniref:uncharacterized protein in vnfD 5'region-like n=1 Tax=Planococcus citri TaxID=170843 RepID=UPI0031F8FA5D
MTLFKKIVIFSMLFSMIIIMTVHQIESTVNISTSQSIEETAHPLPQRNHTWRTIRENNFLYIDKTPFLMKLLEKNRSVILTRPRGFGKTTFLDMMADFFRGKKDLFKGLAIDKVGNTKHYPWNKSETGEPLPKWKEFPVIHLNFAEISNFNTSKEFDDEYLFLLKRAAETYSVDGDENDFDLDKLISKVYFKFNKTSIVILVDEYDHPVQHAHKVLNNKQLAINITHSLESMISVIKANTEMIGFALFAGVMRLNFMSQENSSTNVFSDLTWDKDLSEAFGFTENEIKNNMTPYLKKWAQKRYITSNAQSEPNDPRLPEMKLLDELRSWYGGYQFSIKCDAGEVFSPLSTIESLQQQEFGNYFISTSAMHFLVAQYYEKFSNWESFNELHLYNASSIYCIEHNSRESETPLHRWMLSHGYYTISDYELVVNYCTGHRDIDSVTLKFPNKEIEEAIEYNVAMYLLDENKFIHEDYGNDLAVFNEAMSTQDTEKAMRILSIFKFQPYLSLSRFYRNANPGQMSRSMRFFLHAASINFNYHEDVKFNTATNSTAKVGKVDSTVTNSKAKVGKVDTGTNSTAIVENIDNNILQTTDLNMNYIIRIQTTNSENETALPVIEQLLRYHKHHPEFFTKLIKNQTNVCFLGLNFLHIDGFAKLNSWIALSYTKGTFQISDVVAQPGDLKERLLGKYAP